MSVRKPVTDAYAAIHALSRSIESRVKQNWDRLIAEGGCVWTSVGPIDSAIADEVREGMADRFEDGERSIVVIVTRPHPWHRGCVKASVYVVVSPP